MRTTTGKAEAREAERAGALPRPVSSPGPACAAPSIPLSTSREIDWLRAVLVAVPMPMVAIDFRYAVRYANRAFEILCGAALESLINRSLLEIDDSRWNRPLLRDALGALLERGENFEGIEIDVDRAGVWRHLVVGASRLSIPTGGAELLLVSVEDATERLAAEHRVFGATAELLELYDRAHCGYLVADAAGCILRANRTVLDWLELGTQEPIVGCGLEELIPWEAHKDFAGVVAQSMATGTGGGEFELAVREGNSVPVFGSVRTNRDAAGAFTASHWTFFDARAQADIGFSILTLNRELEARALNLEAANRELEAFSYTISHDLRSPLHHIQGYIELLKRRVPRELDADATRCVATISTAATEMGELVDDLLAFSKSGRSAMQAADVELDRIVSSAIQEFEAEIQGRIIEWRIARLPRVRGDAALLKQVFVNLIGNAIKYSRSREVAVINVGTDGIRHGRLVIFVRDNGVGFDMQSAEQLFGVFQRLHRSEEFEGTGIGLATVRRIVARHGGHTWATAAAGGGATFFLTLEDAKGIG